MDWDEEEGFTQGCRISPVIAAIVLNEILTFIQKEFNDCAAIRKSNGNIGDDGLGTLGIILTCVNDVTSLLYHADACFLLKQIEELATP